MLRSAEKENPRRMVKTEKQISPNISAYIIDISKITLRIRADRNITDTMRRSNTLPPIADDHFSISMMIDTASSILAGIWSDDVPATLILQRLRGMSTLTASLDEIADAILGESSPIMEFAAIMPILPAIISTRELLYITAFSPVAPLSAPAFIIAAVAIEFVPTAIISQVSGTDFLSFSIKALPIPPP